MPPTPLPLNTPVVHDNTDNDGNSTTLKLYSGDQQVTVEWNIVLASGDTRKFAGGYLLVADRGNNNYQTISLDLGDTDEKLYAITSLTNGNRYTVQYNQLMDDGSQISTLTGIISPCARPVALVLNADATATDVSTGSDGSLFNIGATVATNNNSMYSSIDSTLTFKLFQVLEDAATTPSRVVDETNDIITRVFVGSDVKYGDNNDYLLTNIPVGHYKMEVIYSNRYGPSISNLVDVYARLLPNNFTLTAYSGINQMVTVDFEVDHNPNAPINTIEWSIEERNGSSWSSVSNTPALSSISGGVYSSLNSTFSTPSGSKLSGTATFSGLTNKTAYKISAKGVTTAALDSRKSASAGIYYAVPSFHGTDSIVIHPPTSGTTYSYSISHESSTGDFEHRYDISATQDGITVTDTSLDQKKITANSDNILGSLALDGLIVTAKIWDVLTSALEEYWKRDSNGNAPTEFSMDGSNYKLVDRGSVSTAPLSRKLTPDPVTELRVYDRKRPKFSFTHSWNTNTVATTFRVQYGTKKNDYITVTNSELRTVTSKTFVADLNGLLIADNTYSIRVTATNDAGTSSAETISHYYFTANPPEVNTASGSQTGNTRDAVLNAVKPLVYTGWKDYAIVAKITVNGVESDDYIEIGETDYQIPDLDFGDVVSAKVYFKAWYSGYDPRDTHPNDDIAMEYSAATDVGPFTMEKLSDNFNNLTVSQVVNYQDDAESATDFEQKMDSVDITWSRPALGSGSASYSYVITKNGSAGSTVTFTDSDLTLNTVNGTTNVRLRLSDLDYEQTYSITLKSTVTNLGASSEKTSTATSFNVDITPLEWLQNENGYRYTSSEIIAGTIRFYPVLSGGTKSSGSKYWVLDTITYKHGVNAPMEYNGTTGIVLDVGLQNTIYVKVTAHVTNGTNGDVSKTTEYFQFTYDYAAIPQIIPGGIALAYDSVNKEFTFGFSVHSRGSVVNSIYAIFLPTNDPLPSSISFKVPIAANIPAFGSHLYVVKVPYDILPNGATSGSYDDISYFLIASNGLGAGIAENNFC